MKRVVHLALMAVLWLSFVPTALAQITPLDSIKVMVASNRTRDAIPHLERLLRIDPMRAAHNYFLGQCLIREGIRIAEAVNYLEKSAQLYTKHDVDPGMGEPEFVHFYLVIAYTRLRQCEKALQAYYEFMEVYSKADPFYPKEAAKWVELCHEPQRLAQEVDARPALAVGSGLLKDRLVALESTKDSVVTRPLPFSTQSVLYGVQVGALVKPTYTVNFPGLKNVGVYVDENGIYRYVIGNLTFRSQAERLLREVRLAGYPDAFIVDINNPERYKEEVVLLNELSIQRQLVGDVEFRVQIGAFAEALPEHLAQLYFQLEGLREVPSSDLTLLTVGAFKTYALAQNEKDRLGTLEFKDSFIVAFNQGQRIPTSMALRYIETHKQ